MPKTFAAILAAAGIAFVVVPAAQAQYYHEGAPWKYQYHGNYYNYHHQGQYYRYQYQGHHYNYRKYNCYHDHYGHKICKWNYW